jgi:hypothetical protein
MARRKDPPVEKDETEGQELGIKRTCIVCGKEFYGKTVAASYCSRRCREAMVYYRWLTKNGYPRQKGE